MLIAMAGLPGAGKSTLANELAQALGAVVLDKDRVRATLFPAPVLDYSREQNDLAMAAIYTAAASILKARPAQAVILDGRTFLRAYQVRDLLALARAVGQEPRLIECVCADDVARQRLENDLAAGHHPARNRTFAHYLASKASAEPLTLPRLTLDTGVLTLPECVARALAYVRS